MYFKTSKAAENVCPFICPPGRVKRVTLYMMLSFIMYELVEADALISTLGHPFGIFKYNLKMSDLEFCLSAQNFLSVLLIYGLAVWQNKECPLLW